MSVVVHSIRFKCPPDIGTIPMLDAQRYEVIGIEPYIRADGSASILIVWQAWCAETGHPFTLKTGLVAKGINRRCKKHAKPGQAATRAGAMRMRKYLRKQSGRRHV